MAGFTGTALYLAFNGTELDTDYRSLGTEESTDTVEQSAGADTEKTYLKLLKDGTASISIVAQAADTTTWGAVAPGTEGTLEWGEEGTTAGNQRHHVNAIVLSRTKTIEYAGLAMVDISWQFSGAKTDTTY